MKNLLLALLFTVVESRALAIEWPEGKWLGDRPKAESVLSAVAFISPNDLSFFRILNVWKRLEKKYHSIGVEFLLVARSEPFLPFSEELVLSELKESSYRLPVYLDENGSYSKLWRSYIFPTASLVLPTRKVINFDPGNFDPAVFEKILQRTLKEMGMQNLPAREFVNDGITKTCPRSKTYFLGEKARKTLGSSEIDFEGSYASRPYWIEKKDTQTFALEAEILQGTAAIFAEAPIQAKLNISFEGSKIPNEVRGRDVQEDKLNGTFLSVKAPKLYEILRHSSASGSSVVKLKITTTAKDLKIWFLQVLPYCSEFSQ